MYEMSINSFEKISWKYIDDVCKKCELNQSDFPMDLVNNRSREVHDNYIKWKREVGENGLFNMLFKNNDVVVIRKNDFPYNFEEGILHYVIWLRPNQDECSFDSRMEPNLINYAVKQLKKIHGTIEMVHFRNNSKYRTVYTINHYHVIIRLI